MFFSFKKIDQSESSLKNKMQNGGPPSTFFENLGPFQKTNRLENLFYL